MAQKKGLFDWYFKTSLLIRIFVGLLLGAVLGVLLARYAPEFAAKVGPYLDPFGKAFIRLLQMIIVPTVLFTIIVGVASISPSSLGRVGVKILAYYFFTSATGALIGIVLGVIAKPGVGVPSLEGVAAAGKEAAKTAPADIILNFIPTNVVNALSTGSILQIIFFTLMFGAALAYLREAKEERIKNAADTIYKVCDGGAELMFIVIRWIMQYAPIGVFALMFGVFAKNGLAVVGPLVKVTAIVYIGFFIQAILIYGGFLKYSGFKFFPFMKKVRDPMVTAFVTRSSGGTLPLTMKNAENMGVSKGIYSFTLPMGATINMDGTAIYQAVCAVFIANAVGLPLTMAQMVTVVVVSVLASIGTAGVPGAGAIMLLLVLESVGLNVEAGSVVAAAYAMIIGIDAILDMGRTSLNVVGDTVGTAIVAKSEKEMNLKTFEAFDGKTIG